MVAECPVCESVRVKVYDSRPQRKDGTRLRWKKCSSCGAKWMTRETFERMVLKQGHPTRGNGVTY